LRVIAGDLRGKKLSSIKGHTTRPTSDKLRETIFNIFQNRLGGKVVLDLFAGTGALGIESLSRGASFSTFIDINKQAIDVIKKNLRSCGLESKSTVIQWNIKKDLKCLETFHNKIDLVFMDPPYHSNLITPALRHLHHTGTLRRGAFIIVEHSNDEAISYSLERFALSDQREYRKTALSIFLYEGN